jgi:uncharacterized protein YcbX
MAKRILSEIWVYPVKGLGGVRQKSARVLQKGLVHDRRWMLVDSTNRFMTQREFPVLSLFRTRIDRDTIIISKGAESIRLPIMEEMAAPVIETMVWDDPVTTIEVSRQHSDWFSQRVGISCKLVAFPEGNPRPVSELHQVNHEHVSLADGYPLMIIGQASLDNLNTKLASPVPMNRFRPNLVFTGGEPHEEDSWKNFLVGTNRFAGVKPCARCIVTTINQATGEKEREPLLTLSRYRKRDTDIYFGQNVLAIDFDEIREGDEITF